MDESVFRVYQSSCFCPKNWLLFLIGGRKFVAILSFCASVLYKESTLNKES